MSSRAASIDLTFFCAATLSACAGNRESPAADLAAAQTTTICVNSYLGRAALDTLSFAPMAQVDSAGGVIVTDWYADPNSPAERVKVTATIRDSHLRGDALKVATSRQTNQTGQGRSEEPTSDLQSLMRTPYAALT